MKNKAQYLAYKDFLPSLRPLMQKGGLYQKAGKTVLSAWGLANSDGQYSYDEVFAGMTMTNHGENRIAHCVKFDLTGFARLVTAYSSDVCIFLFAGDHTAVDAWLDRNKGLDFIVRDQGSNLRVDPVFVSDMGPGKHGLIQSETDYMINGPVIDQLNDRYKEKLLGTLDSEIKDEVRTIEPYSDEDAVLDVVSRVSDVAQGEALLDVLLALRSSDLIKAKNRIDLYEKSAKPISMLTEQESVQIVSSENTVRVQDVDPVLFEHFVRTADFKEWMLFLHPSQREIVSRDFNGPTRLAGVSGSGKTCVVIHRALRLARQSPNHRVLILTLNDALAKLICELIDAESGQSKPKNIITKSVFELCREKLLLINPEKKDYYSKQTIAVNGFAVPDHIDEIWEEYFHCRHYNMDADCLLEVARTLLVRNVFPKDYLRQEFDYVRSAFAPNERNNYLDMERSGRVIPLTRRYREVILEGLSGWAKKMNIVGAIDDIGIVTALYEHLEKLTAEYDHVLVDEVQDLGTLELKIIRKLTKPGQNDLFLSGDAAQTVHTKHSDFKAAEIDLPSVRWLRLSQNYRNSRQILAAAHQVLTRSFEVIPAGTTDLEIIPPEFANFTSPNPLLLSASSVQEELAMAMNYAVNALKSGNNKKACIALCGYSQAAVEVLGKSLELPVLCGSTVLSEGALFISDLEQTKGFEFDLMIVLNCGDRVIPHPELPEHESFRELCKLYVALTRAKTELVVSYNGAASRFIELAKVECFNTGTWAEHVENPSDFVQFRWPAPALRRIGDKRSWGVSGKDFLRMREAVGLSTPVQQEILEHVTGTPKTQGKIGSASKQIEWRDFSSFYQDMEKPRNRGGILSEEAWTELKGRIEPLIQNYHSTDDDLAENSALDEIPLVSTPSVLFTPPIKAAEERITFHRHDGVLSFSPSTLSAHTLASLLAIQSKESVDALEIGSPMRRDLLEFLLPRNVLTEWLVKRRMREVSNSENAIALTKAGLDECVHRIEILNEVTRPLAASTATSAKRVAEYRAMILSGKASERMDQKFFKKSFVIHV